MGLFSSKPDPDTQQADAVAEAEAVDTAHDAKLDELQGELAALETNAPEPAASQDAKPALNPTRAGTNLDRLRQRVLEESTRHANAPDLSAPVAPAVAETAQAPEAAVPQAQPPESPPLSDPVPVQKIEEKTVSPSTPFPNAKVMQPAAATLPVTPPAENTAPATPPVAEPVPPSPMPEQPLAGAVPASLAEPISPGPSGPSGGLASGEPETDAPVVPPRLAIETQAPLHASPASEPVVETEAHAPSEATSPQRHTPPAEPLSAPATPARKPSSIPLRDISAPMQFKNPGSTIPNIVPAPSAEKAGEKNESVGALNAHAERSPLAGHLTGSASGGVRPIRTFKDDIASVVTHKQTSLVSVIAAEEEKRGKEEPSPAHSSGLSPKAYFLLGISVALVVVGLATYVVLPLLRSNQPTIPIAQVPSFIFTDSQDPIDITNRSRSEVINRLIAAKDGVRVRLGAITHLYLTETYIGPEGTSQVRLVTAPDFLSQIDARAPAYLVRALEPTMMLGIHEYDGNQPFLILKVNDYENAFAGMLEWEQYLNADLAPLFGPLLLPVRASPEGALTEEPAATSTENVVTTSEPDVGYRFAPPFVDSVIRNIEVRVQHNEEGGIALLYGFLDKQTIVITTAEPTFEEIYTRATSRRF